MRLPRAEVAPWAHGHYERKALRPGREGAAAGPRRPQQRQPARPRPAGAFTLEGPHEVSTQICVETSWGQRPCLGRRAQRCRAGLRQVRPRHQGPGRSKL